MKNFLKKKPTYSRPSAKVIMTLLPLLLALCLFKDTINMPTSTSHLITGVMTLIIIFNIIKIHPPKNQWRTILEDLILVAIFLTIIFFLIFDISIFHRIKFIDIESKITNTSFGSGLIAIIGAYFFYQRLEKQQKQIDIQINQRVDDRFNSAISLLGSSETSARTGAIYALYELAIEEEKYRRQIAQILCSHIRSKTNETEYKDTHSERPSNEIQTTIDLLFKEKGLYAKEFAREDEFPKANLSHAYLMGADFRGALCQGAIFYKAQCQGAGFYKAQCQGVDFFDTQFQGAYFGGSQFQGAGFWGAQFQGAGFRDAQFQGADFRDAQFQGADFWDWDAQFDEGKELQLIGEIDDIAIKAIKDARPYLNNSWYEKMQKIIKENKGKDPKTVNIQNFLTKN
ncbi:hypothetical protein BAZOLSSOX_2306 [uncultured Gammaproteobacteria bacterium]|nr:hypothetical protein BAZOLSSOX_2306 [uncultured Gammaproteobacteria bacterium]